MILPNKKALIRFWKYATVGGSTFALDLCLLYVLTDIFQVYYVLSAGIAFVCAISVNYLISRRFVFPETDRPLGSGYVIFMMIGLTGLLLVTSLMYVFVDMLYFDYLTSRVMIAGIVGMWNYLMNLYVNFRVASR